MYSKTYKQPNQLMQKCYLLREIERGGKLTPHYKIGETSQADTQNRVNGYRAGNFRELRTIFEIEVANSKATELQIHKHFADQRITGCGGGDEWFEFTDPQIPMDYMNQLGQGVIPNMRKPIHWGKGWLRFSDGLTAVFGAIAKRIIRFIHKNSVNFFLGLVGVGFFLGVMNSIALLFVYVGLLILAKV